MQVRGIAVQSRHYHHLLGRDMQHLRRPRRCVLCEQSLHGAEYHVPDRNLRGVRWSESTLLRQSDSQRIGNVLARLRMPERHGRSVYLRRLRWQRATLLRRERLRDGCVQDQPHLSVASADLPRLEWGRRDNAP